MICILAMLSITIAHAGASEKTNRFDSYLETLIIEGLTHNENLKAAEADIKTLKSRISPAGSFDDPVIGIGVLNLPVDSLKFDQEAMTQKQIFVSQKFPWFGKLDLKTRLAATAVSRQEALLDAQRLELVREISQAYYNLGYTAASMNINNQLGSVIRRLLNVTETRYASGEGLQQDVLHAQVELSRIFEENIALEMKRADLQILINELIGRDASINVVPPKYDFYQLRLAPEDELKKLAVTETPMIRLKHAELSSAGLAVELSRKSYWPDMNVKLAYGQRDEDRNGNSLTDFVSASVAMNIPLWQANKQDKLVDSDRAHLESVKASYRGLLLSLPRRVETVANNIRQLHKNYEFNTKALIPQMKQLVTTSTAAYKVGKIEFRTMMDAHTRLLEAQRKTADYLFRVKIKMAQLDELTGMSMRYVRKTATRDNFAQEISQDSAGSPNAENYRGNYEKNQ